MSLFSSFNKRSVLDTAIKQVSKARKAEAAAAENLYQDAYQGFAKAIADNLIVSEALYNWGFALLNQAKNQEQAQAVELLEDAVAKFSFCLLTAPNYLAAAIDGGVAFMELARLNGPESTVYLHKMARQYFENACRIQKGSAAYNLACLHAMDGEHDACLQALNQAYQNGCLPDEAVILADVDMAAVVKLPWFAEFLESTKKQPEVSAEEAEAESGKINYEPKFNLKKKDDFDYYAKDQE